MRISRPASKAAIGCAALALALTGCGGGNGAADGDATSPSAKEQPLGPLDVYYQEIYGGGEDEEAMQAKSDAQQVKVEEIVAACMREQGFEYTPVDYSSMTSYSSDADLDVEFGSKEFAEKYGYGITTNPWGNSEPAPEEDGEQFVDPNQAYQEAMSPTEQQAFQTALYGDMSEMEAPVEEEEPAPYDWTTAGCQGRAQHEVYEVGGLGAEEMSALDEQMTAMYESITADPRIAELNAEWASCMADAGYDGLVTVAGAQEQFYEKVNALQEEFYGMDPETGEMTGEPPTAEQMEATEKDMQAAMSALTPEEIKMAVADFDCREGIDFDAIQQKVNVEYQQDFVDEHKAELDAWVAKAAEAGQ